MRPLDIAGTSGLLLALVLAGCSDQSTTTPEIDAWLQDQDAAGAELPEGHSVMSARESPDAPYRDDEGIRLDYEVPHQVNKVTFSCFGTGSTRLRLNLQSIHSGQGFDHDSYECEQSPHEVDLSLMDPRDVNEVIAQGYEASEAGAWSVVVEATPE